MRGEVVMRKQEFERLNQLQEQGNSRVYSNARNLGNPPPPPLYVFSVQSNFGVCSGRLIEPKIRTEQIQTSNQLGYRCLLFSRKSRR